MPINLDTINTLYSLNLTSFQLEEFLASVAEPRDVLRTSEDVVVSKVGRHLYEKFFHYNMDQVVAQALSLFRKLSSQDMEQTQHELTSSSSAS